MAKGHRVGADYAFSNASANRAKAPSAKPRPKKGGPALSTTAGNGCTPGSKDAC